MHKIDGYGATTDGHFVEGDPTTGRPSTWLTADWTNAIQDELIGVLDAAGVAPNKANNLQLVASIKKLVRLACPVGTLWEGYAVEAPPQTLELNGALVSRTTYADLYLFAVSLGLVVAEDVWAASAWTKFGVGDGATTFRLPDLREEFVASIGAGRPLATWRADEMRAHSHSYTRNPATLAGGAERGGADAVGEQGAVTGSTGGAETRPRSVSLMRCIYY